MMQARWQTNSKVRNNAGAPAIVEAASPDQVSSEPIQGSQKRPAIISA
jgi:hypothetical protein